MNRASRRLEQGNMFSGQLQIRRVSKETTIILLQIFLILGTALFIVYTKHIQRQLTGDINHLVMSNHAKQVEYGQLLIEKNTWGTGTRIHQLAKEKYGMVFPTGARNHMVALP